MKTKTYLIHYNTYIEPKYIRSVVITAPSRDNAIKHFERVYRDGIIRDISEYSKERGKRRMDLDKKITVTLDENDIKEIIAEYVMKNSSIRNIDAKNVEMVYGVKYSGPPMDRVDHGYLKECVVKC